MGCIFRFFRLILVLLVLAVVCGAFYYYTRLHPEKAFWKDGASAVKDKVATVTLSTQVKAALSLREALNGLNIDVSTEKDVVTLRGKVPNAEASKTAESTAASVPGVRQIVNFLEIDSAAGAKPAGPADRSMGEKLDDEGLELKIRAAFKLDKNLAKVSFDVTSIKRAVQISSSTATMAQKQRAAEVAKSVEGVLSVEIR